mmetsp:Transcript_10517/g.11580  ORF Transcript_10517/g.11580 Transcript_10517/m.11580 type:complete len:153 (+) Transcript_10517:342-800(+)
MEMSSGAAYHVGSGCFASVICPSSWHLPCCWLKQLIQEVMLNLTFPSSLPRNNVVTAAMHALSRQLPMSQTPSPSACRILGAGLSHFRGANVEFRQIRCFFVSVCMCVHVRLCVLCVILVKVGIPALFRAGYELLAVTSQQTALGTTDAIQI